MKNSQFLRYSILAMLFMSFQKIVAQPRFIIEDKVVFVAGGSSQSQAAAASQFLRTQQVTKTNAVQGNAAMVGKSTQPPHPSQDSIIEDVVVFSTNPDASNPTVLKLDSIHKKLLALKKGRYDKANAFAWYNPHPTTSMNLEGYNILIIAPSSNKILAELRFVRQKTNVWIDVKFNSSKNTADVKSVVYSEANRKATVETFGGYKFSLSINAQTGKIDVTPFKVLATDMHLLNNAEVHIYKTGKLY